MGLGVIFYKTGSGKDVVVDWVRSFNAEDRKVIGEDLRTVQEGFPIGLPVCDNLGKGLWEVRSSLPSRQEVRLFFFQDKASNALVVVHGIVKKTQKTPPQALELARKRMREFNT